MDGAYRLWSNYAETALKEVAMQHMPDAVFTSGRGTTRVDVETVWPPARRATTSTLHERRLCKQ
eukprot:11122320-Prorocentrum_lima.AAC.1